MCIKPSAGLSTHPMSMNSPTTWPLVHQVSNLGLYFAITFSSPSKLSLWQVLPILPPVSPVTLVEAVIISLTHATSAVF